MTFEAFRENGEPTYFSAVHLPWEADLLVCGIVYAFVIVFISFLCIVPGIAGIEKFLFVLRVFLSLFIGASILVTNFAMTWETAETVATTKYKAGTGEEINATIGVNIGLRGVNITLKADNHSIQGETIDYNEKFSWEGQQGRHGFGPFAGRFNREYRAAQFRGLPLPILWVAEYFTLDGEGIRWGRYYRQAGWYTHIMLWLAFPLWILTNILFFVLLRYGAYFLMMTGTSMLIANAIWATQRNPTRIEIPFSQTDVLEFSFGPSFWICLFVGTMCVVFGALVFLMDKCFPSIVAKFFGVDILQDSESVQVEGTNDTTVIVDNTYSKADLGGDESVPPTPADNDDALYVISGAPAISITNTKKGALTPLKMSEKKHHPQQLRSFKSAESRLTKRMQRPRRKANSQNSGVYSPNSCQSLSSAYYSSVTPHYCSTAINMEGLASSGDTHLDENPYQEYVNCQPVEKGEDNSTTRF